ncbi:MAG: methyltransferase family protein [Roseiflexaceae bacterium]
MSEYKQRGDGWVLAQLALFAAIGLAPGRIAGLPDWPSSLRRPGRLVGLLLGSAGLLLMSAATNALGPSFTIFPRPRDDGAFIQQGVYSVVRHPIYAGTLLVALGWSLLRGSTPALALTAVLGVALDQKARREEAWLARRFAEYGDYRRRVRKLIPWVY